LLFSNSVSMDPLQSSHLNRRLVCDPHPRKRYSERVVDLQGVA